MKTAGNVSLILFIGTIVFFTGCGSNGNSTSGSEKTKTIKTKTDKKTGKKVSNTDSQTNATKKAAKDTEDVIPGKDESEFIPKGWKIIDKITGDLDGDSQVDSALQLENKEAEEDDEFDHRMIVLFKTSDGKYRMGAEAKKLIRCTFCGGMLGGVGLATVKIEKGVLIVSQMYGSREGTDYLLRFRYEKRSKRFLLIGEDVRNFDRGTGKADSTSTNYLTGEQIVTKEEVNDKGDDVVVSKTNKTVPKSKKYIEDVSYKSY